MTAANNPAGVTSPGFIGCARLHQQWNNVKINEANLRIENFDVVADWSAALSQGFPIESSNTFIQAFADGLAGLKSEQSASRFIQVSNSAFRIGDDNSFLNGVEHGF